MKMDELYDFYINYLVSRLECSKISNSELKLLMISESYFIDYFIDFKYRFEHDEKFALTFTRDRKIDDILDETN